MTGFEGLSWECHNREANNYVEINVSSIQRCSDIFLTRDETRKSVRLRLVEGHDCAGAFGMFERNVEYTDDV